MADTVAIALTETLTEGTTTQTTKRTFNVSDATITQSIDDKFTVATGATDLAVDFDGFGSVKYLTLTFSAPLTVKIGSNTAPALAFPAGGVLCIAGATVSAIYVTNAGTAPVTVTRVAATP
jgi:hypothetical protein